MPYFTLTDSSGGLFVLKLESAPLVVEARSILAGKSTDIYLSGQIVKGPSEYNIGWNFVLDEKTLNFSDATSPWGDVSMGFIQANLSSVGTTVLPTRLWTGSSTRLTGELDLKGGSNRSETLVVGANATIVLARGGNDTIVGGAKGDILSGGAGDDTIAGNSGNDRIDGNLGHDKLQGNDGDDFLFGGAGNDRIDGRDGLDRLYGGVGSDTFVIKEGSGQDLVYGFQDNAGGIDQDRVDLKDLGLSNWGQVERTAKGFDLIIGHGGDTVRLVDYLRTHDFSDFTAQDVLLG